MEALLTITVNGSLSVSEKKENCNFQMDLKILLHH